MVLAILIHELFPWDLILYISLISLGGGLFFFGGWNIDFAHLAWERWAEKMYLAGLEGKDRPPRDTVGLPGPWKDAKVDAAFWWNLGFFGFMWPAFFITIAGVVGIMFWALR